MVRKLFFAIILAANLVFSLPVYAQNAETTISPEFNPLCWKKDACNKTRRQLVGSVPGGADTSVGDGFVVGSSAYPCIGGDVSDPWGKCLPANIAITEIAFGGQNRFANIGDFIEKNYRFAIAMAGVVAAVVVVISGLQWATSGGNAETIGSAKQRIVNSIIGIFIAYTSYFILNTINPNLVNLRLPQTWMLRPLETMPKFCSYAKTDANFQEATKDQNATRVELPNDPTYPLTYSQITGEGAQQNCGTRYFVKGGGSFMCYGDNCGSGQTCSNFDPADPERKDYHCIRASVVGEISGNYVIEPTCGLGNISDVFAGYKYPWVEDGSNENDIFKVCVEDGGAYTWAPRLYELNLGLSLVPNPGIGSSPGRTSFAFAGVSNLDESCPAEGEFFYGYVVGMTLIRRCTTNDDVAIDRYGSLLGKLDRDGKGYYISGSRRITDKDVFSGEEIRRGQRMTIDVAQFKPQGTN